MTLDARIRLRRRVGMAAVALLLLVDLYATGLFGGGERVLAIVRTLVLPGLPFLEWNVPLGLLCIVAALSAVGAWLRWGMDWAPVLVVAICVGIAGFVMPLHHEAGAEHGSEHAPESTHAHDEAHGHAREGTHAHEAVEAPAQGPSSGVAPAAVKPGHDGAAHGDGHPHTKPHAHPPGHVHHEAGMLGPARADAAGDAPAPRLGSHEFTVVLVVFALVARLRLMFDRLPGSAWLRQRMPAGLAFPAVDIARGACIAAIAGAAPEAMRHTLADARLCTRARRVNAWARFRWRGDALDGAHAPLRAALALAGELDAGRREALRTEAAAHPCGVPASEPTWGGPPDGLLAALALDAMGEVDSVARWRSTFEARFALRHGRRPAALHVPSMLAIGTAAAWEHAAATALGRQAGWLGDDDWLALRKACLGAAAGGARDAQTLRFVAAGMLWAVLLEDAEALAILSRRTVDDDAIARSLRQLARRFPVVGGCDILGQPLSRRS